MRKPSVISQIVQFNRGRDPELLKLKFKKMAASPFCFFRGSDHLFAAAWRGLRPVDSGPFLLSCGDLHLENFGIFAADDGKVRFGINDFDEALVAPASFDVVRCVASIFLAAEDWELHPIQASTLALAFISNYRTAVVDAVGNGRASDLVLGQRQKTIFDQVGLKRGNQTELLRTFTATSTSGKPKIIIDDKHIKLDMSERQLIRAAVEAFGKRLGQVKAFKVLDVTGRIAGIGSLGLKRYTALIRGHGSKPERRLLDIKAAKASSVLSAASAKQPRFGHNQAKRIVAAQIQLQGGKARGLDVIRIGQQDYRVRDTIPDENRFSLNAFSENPSRLRSAIELAGKITGWAHFRGLQSPSKTSSKELADWVNGPGLDAVLSSSIRFADWTVEEFETYKSFGLDAIKRLVHKSKS